MGAGIATLLMAVYQIFHMVQRIASGRRPPRMPVSLQYCPNSITVDLSSTNQSRSQHPEVATRLEEEFFLFRLSFFWSSFFAIVGTLLGGILLSAVTGEMRTKTQQSHLTSDALLRLWRKCRWPVFRSSNEAFQEETKSRKYALHQVENGKLLTEEVEALPCES